MYAFCVYASPSGRQAVYLHLLLRFFVSKDGDTALMLAAKKGHVEVCVKLAELGADVNLANRVRKKHSRCFFSPFSLFAVSFRFRSLFLFLVAWLCWCLLLFWLLYCPNQFGMTAMNWAAFYGNTETCLRLVEFGADLNCIGMVSDRGQSAWCFFHK